MFCSKCGKELNSTETFCPKCGTRINQQPFQPIATKEVTNAKPIKSKTIAIIGIVIVLVMIVMGSITFAAIKYSSKPERLVIGNWSMSGSGVGQTKTSVNFTKDGRLITANESKDDKVTYEIDSSDKNNIKLIIKDGSTNTKLNLKFIGRSKFELTSPDQGSEVITFERN